MLLASNRITVFGEALDFSTMATRVSRLRQAECRVRRVYVGFLQCLVCPLYVPFPDFESNVLLPSGRCGKVNGGFGWFMSGLISTCAARWRPSDDSGPYCEPLT